MSSQAHTLHSRTVSLKGRTGPSSRWCAKEINTTCHIINRVYLQKFFKKTSYELMVCKKPNVTYFKVFGAPCWIQYPHHQSKFAPKSYEDFMLSYGLKSHTYRVFNKT